MTQQDINLIIRDIWRRILIIPTITTLYIDPRLKREHD
jgi:hypothetical protein